jgi:hypothetical protein
MDQKTLERFEKYINKTDTCWLWTGTLVNGYGQFRFQGRPWRASRLMYLSCYGEIPEGYDIAHVPIFCHNRACVNPDHLEATTKKINESHKVLDGTDNRGEKHGSAKLTAEQVLEIRKSNKTQTSLAKEFGVTRQQIGDIIRRKKWAHL